LKAKLVAVLTAIVLMTGCQSDAKLEDKSQNELNIDNKKVTQEDQNKSNPSNQSENKSTQPSSGENAGEEVSENAGNTDGSGSKAAFESTKDNEEETVENTVDTQDQDASIPTDTVLIPPENAGLEVIENDRIGSIPADQIKEGVLEACTVLSEIHSQLNEEGLELIEFDGLYEPYYKQTAFTNIETLRKSLENYFTQETTEDLIEYWNLIEYNNQLLAPEQLKSVGYSLDGLDLVISESMNDSQKRFVNMSFLLGEEKKNSLLILSQNPDAEWKLSTIPGKGLLTSHDGQFIRDAFWIEGHTDWSWPEFIATEDKAWTDVMIPLQDEIRASIQEKTSDFQADAKFKAIGAKQLSYWISWTYAEPNKAYPYVHVVESEYIKYGIHPNHTRRTVTLSKQEGVKLTLDQIYTEKEAFEEVVNVAIDVYMRDNKDAFYNDVVFEGVNDHTQFYLTQTGIVFYFQLYEYAPYAFGYPEIEVPFTALKDVLNDSFQQFVIVPSNDIIDE